MYKTSLKGIKENLSRKICDVYVLKDSILIRCQLSKIRHKDQWNSSENPEIDPYLKGQLTFFAKGAKVIHWGNPSLFNYRCQYNSDIHLGKKNEHQLLPHTIYEN